MDELAFPIVAASESSFWACPDYILNPLKNPYFWPSHALVSKNELWRPKSRFSKSCSKSFDTFRIASWTLPKCPKTIPDRFPTSTLILERFFENGNFYIFSNFFLHFSAYFRPKSLKKWVKKWIFQLFFKNEAFNQKSELVKLLGCGRTCFPDSGGFRKLILSLPPLYSEPLEKPLFLAFSGVSK